MAIPTFVADGTGAAGTGTITPGLPAGVAEDDILILVIEMEGETEAAAAAPSGDEWTLIDTIASATDGQADRTRCTTYWHRYDGSTDPNRVVPDSGDHTGAKISAFRGCETSGTPVHVSATNADSTNSTSYSAVGPVTTVDDCLIVFTGTVGDQATISSEANSNLSSLTLHYSNGHTAGSNGGVSVVSGGLASAGDSGTLTATINASEEQAHVCFALMEPQVAGVGPKGPLGHPLHGPFGGPIGA